MHPQGFFTVTACSPLLSVANPIRNAEIIIEHARANSQSDLILFPELSLTGYTCADLFQQSTLLDTALQALRKLGSETKTLESVVVVGLPLTVDGRLYNTAAVLHRGIVIAIVPKQFLPNYTEFYEQRWFQSGSAATATSVQIDSTAAVPFGTDLLVKLGRAVIGIEICEDLWVPVPPSSIAAIAGANLLLNLSASNETIGKASYRQMLVASQSGRCAAAYIYASAGPHESTTDLVFGGHCIIAEAGSVLVEHRFAEQNALLLDDVTITESIDIAKLEHDRRIAGSFHSNAALYSTKAFRVVEIDPLKKPSKVTGFARRFQGRPFVPKQSVELDARCREIYAIQCVGLAKRVQQLNPLTSLTMGISGGLDSTLALIVAVRMLDETKQPRKRLLGLSMPGFGTSDRTRRNARRLIQLLGISGREIDIRQSCLDTFRSLQHLPFGIDISETNHVDLQDKLESLAEESRSDLIFENVQARTRTLLLMNSGFVLGTGDLSEAALGWSTYNADHMSMYNVNCSVPKTLVRFLVQYAAQHHFDGEVRDVLLEVVDTPISPELLPLSKDRQIAQSTESSIGPYEVHDFYLYHFIRTGSSPERLLFLAKNADFSHQYSDDVLRSTLIMFLKRFFANQFKRSCVPDGPKVGSVSLSPRGDWRMPSDASVQAWIDALENDSSS